MKEITEEQIMQETVRTISVDWLENYIERLKEARDTYEYKGIRWCQIDDYIDVIETMIAEHDRECYDHNH